MHAIRLLHRIAAMLGALLLLGGAAWAQSTTATPTPKPKPAPKHTAKPAQRTTNDDYWSVNYAAPTRYDTGRAAPRHETTELSGEMGRMPLQSGQGTIGFESRSHLSASVPGGADPYARKEASFTGLSITVPSDSKNIALPVLPTPWSRPE